MATEIWRDPEKNGDKKRYVHAEGDIWKKWISFIKDPENIKHFHPYSPEYHDIIRCGKSVSWLPNLDQHLYNKHMELHQEEVSRPLPAAVRSSKCLLCGK